jgi:hypothetical protein
MILSILSLVCSHVFVLQTMLLKSRPVMHQLQAASASTSTTNPAYHPCGGTQSLYTTTKMQERYDVSYNL